MHICTHVCPETKWIQLYPYYGPLTPRGKSREVQACEYMNLCMEGDRPYLPFLVILFTSLVELAVFHAAVLAIVKITTQPTRKTLTVTLIR